MEETVKTGWAKRPRSGERPWGSIPEVGASPDPAMATDFACHALEVLLVNLTIYTAKSGSTNGATSLDGPGLRNIQVGDIVVVN